MPCNIKLFTEWAESTAGEKTGQKTEKTAPDRAMEVNSSGRKSVLFQGSLAKTPLPERQFQPSIVGGPSAIRTFGAGIHSCPISLMANNSNKGCCRLQAAATVEHRRRRLA
jgi:hypothetical protein